VGSRRIARVQDLVKEEIARLLLFKIKDPRLRSVTVTHVKMTADLRRAVVFYGVFDDDMDRDEVNTGLVQAAGFIRREVGRTVGLKFVPHLEFEFDQSMEYAQHIDRLFKELGIPAGVTNDEEQS
jgi:ribosome-binding factor A